MSLRVVLIGFAVGFASTAAHAATIYVDDDNCPGPGSGTERDPFCSIQTAIDNAVNTDEIVVAPGTYFETINFLGKAVWLQSSDGPEVTTIDGQGMGSVVTCDSGEGAGTVLEGFTITGGSGTDLGNGLLVGGGMLNLAASPTVVNCTFSGNAASFSGGGMSNRSGGNPMVTGCVFTGNWADLGGGMANGSSNPTVIDCTFSGNTADQNGGGMYNIGSIPSSPTGTGCTFEGNTADDSGGGMYNNGGCPTVTDCTFLENAADLGGGIYNRSSDLVLTQCTFVGNAALNHGHVDGGK